MDADLISMAQDAEWFDTVFRNKDAELLILDEQLAVFPSEVEFSQRP